MTPAILELSAPHDSRDSEWLAMRAALWPQASKAEHLLGMADAMTRGHYVLLARGVGGVALGFVEASKRVDYVNGTENSPVAFLEGIYVVPEFRLQGVARRLVDAVIIWAKAHGCCELASDSLLPNTDAHAAHRALGFEETERVVYFRKALAQA
jgi:aminoglycoside 6'-N-acetyltransferase I